MNRRHFLAWTGASLAGTAFGQNAFQARDLDHLEFTAADVDKSVDFYGKLFGGADVMKNRQTTRRYIKLGQNYMAIDRADTPRIDHFCAGISGFDINAVHASLTSQGIAYRDFPSGRDLAVTDPDGTRMQLAAADGWSQLSAQTASPEPRPGEGIFRPVRLHYILLNVSDLEAATAHYTRLLGSAQRSRSRVAFPVGPAHVLLQKTPEGSGPGVQRFSVLAVPRDANLPDALETLRRIAPRTEPAEIPSSAIFRDPDGFQVEVLVPQ